MRIVVSGTHASGKSTLVSDFARAHSEFTVLPDPFELMDEDDDAPSAASFAAQLRIASRRLIDEISDQQLIAERGPLDFLAYLLASAELTGPTLDDSLLERAVGMTATAMSTVDLLVILPLTPREPIAVSSDEHIELRDAMNDVLRELADDSDLIAERVRVVEITGSPSERLQAVEALLPGT